jgi:hypothetical protein
MSLAQLQRALYFAQRTIGDARAARRGPDVLARRIARRLITREAFRIGGNR